MTAIGRLLADFSRRRRPLRSLGASGQLGYGIPTPALEAGLARAPDMIGVDMGSIDIGPAYLGDAVKIELRVGAIVPKSKGISLVCFDVELFSEARQVLARVSHRFLLKTTI